MRLVGNRARRAFACLLLASVLMPCASADESTALERFEFSSPQMGVPFRIVLYAPDRAVAESASEAAFRRVSALNEIMSDYETDSELNELSRTSGKGTAVPVSPDLWDVLEQAQRWAALSDGAFDVTVGPAVTLWRRARRIHQLPETDRLERARKAVGFGKVRLNPADHTVTLTEPGMKLDLGGIAKGYALDQALLVLKTNGISRALVSGGGDMALGQPPPGQPGWRIEIAPLDVPNAPPKRYVRLAEAGLATSGDVFQRVEIDGRRYSHIVDPRTGIGLTDHSLVTIIAPNCTTADAVATAVSVLGPRAGLDLVEKIPGVDAHLVRRPGSDVEMKESTGFHRYYEPSKAE